MFATLLLAALTLVSPNGRHQVKFYQQRQPDGTYVGVITIFQTFRGYDKEGNLAYKDTTKKDITVYVKRKETQIGGRTIGFWDVLLGDMRVKETTNR
jgi:hypothetical protein